MSCAFPVNGFLLTKAVLEWKPIQLALLRVLHHLRILVDLETMSGVRTSHDHMKLER